MDNDLQRPWFPSFSRIRGNVVFAIANQIEEAIRSGILRPGDSLPTQRAVAHELGFHLNTINSAYQEAARRGLIWSRSRRGSVVYSDAKNPYSDEPCDLLHFDRDRA